MATFSNCSRLVFRTLRPAYGPIRFNNVSVIQQSAFRRMYCSKPIVDPPKMSLWQRLKVMYKDYWYVTVPVHCATSVVWFGGFYQVARSGIDIPKYMKWMGFSDSIVDKLAGSGAGNIAVAYALYKIATPARYTVTLGCATWAINILKNRGYIRTAKQISQSTRDTIAKRREQFRANKASSGSASKGKGLPE